MSDTKHMVQGLAAGEVDDVTKPIAIEKLFARIRVHLGNTRAAQSALDLPGANGVSTLALAFVGPADPGEFLFRLSRREADETLLSGRYGLTLREAEVLVWVARGK